MQYSKTTQSDPQETARVFFDPAIGMHLFVDSPVKQRVKMDAERFLYYYPDKNIALAMDNRDATLASASMQLFLYTDSEDLGLSNIGFKLINYSVKNDTLIKKWEIKGKKKRESIQIEVYIHHERVQKTRSYDGFGKQIKEVVFSHWYELNNYFYPMHLSIKENDRISEYDYKQLKLLESIPDSILAMFILPEDCEIHEYQF
ncbi:MAG: hypothetical protein U9N86_16285 [Bacteroidota bacterium]|nr:hypothetical protein [Bacteroidota bacterium]